MEGTHKGIAISCCKCCFQICKTSSIHLRISWADGHMQVSLFIWKLDHFVCHGKCFRIYCTSILCKHKASLLFQRVQHSPGSYLMETVAGSSPARHDHNVPGTFFQEKLCHVAAGLINGFQIRAYTSHVPRVVLDCLIVLIAYGIGAKCVVDFLFLAGFDHILKPVCISGKGNDSLRAFCLGFRDKCFLRFRVCNLSWENKFHRKTFLNIIPVIICKHFHLCRIRIIQDNTDGMNITLCVISGIGKYSALRSK